MARSTTCNCNDTRLGKVTRVSSPRPTLQALSWGFLPLNVRPVRLRDSLYLLIPVDIARLVGVVTGSNFSLSLSENPESVRLVYELKKDAQIQKVNQKP